MKPIDSFYLDAYKISQLIEKGQIVPSQAFSYFEPTGEESLDAFYREFWEKTKQPNGEERLIRQCNELTNQYPAFALMQHVIGAWLYADKNVFHYLLSQTAIIYALAVHINRGGELTDKTKMFLQQNSLLAYESAEMSKPAVDYLRGISPELIPEPSPVSATLPETLEELFSSEGGKDYYLSAELKDELMRNAAEAAMEPPAADIEKNIALYYQFLRA